MNAKKGFSKKDLADQNAKVAELGKEESKLLSAIERGEKALAENREKLKETQRSKAAENATLEQMIQKGIKAAARGESDQRAALIAALLMGSDGEPNVPASDPQPDPNPATSRGSASTPTPTSAQTAAENAPPESASGDDEQTEAA